MSFISFLFLFVYTLLSAFLLVGGMVGSESLIFSYVLYFAVKIWADDCVNNSKTGLTVIRNSWRVARGTWCPPYHHFFHLLFCFLRTFGSQFFSLFLEKDQVLDQDIREVLVNYPIHKLEANKSYGKDNPTIFVNVTGSYPEHFIDILWSHHWNGLHHFRCWGARSRRGRRGFLVESSRKASHRVSIIVLGDGILSTAPLTVPAWIMHLQIWERRILQISEFCKSLNDELNKSDIVDFLSCCQGGPDQELHLQKYSSI